MCNNHRRILVIRPYYFDATFLPELRRAQHDAIEIQDQIVALLHECPWIKSLIIKNHHDHLSKGEDVIAAGEFKFIPGLVIRLQFNPKSGRYKPDAEQVNKVGTEVFDLVKQYGCSVEFCPDNA